MLQILADSIGDGQVFYRLVDVLIRITIVLIVGSGISLFFRQRSASFRHGWWLAVLLAIVIVPAAAVALPNWGPSNPLLSRVEESKPIPETQPRIDPTPSPLRSDIPFVSQRKRRNRDRSNTLVAPALADHSEAHQVVSDPTEPTNSSVTPSLAVIVPPHRAPLNRGAWLAVAWSIGFIVMLAKILLGWSRMSRILKQARSITDDGWQRLTDSAMSRLGFRRNVELCESTREIGPLTGGWLKPFVLLPLGCDQWPHDLREVVLLHELAHAKRLDVLSLWCTRLIGALLWFHPLVWLAIRQLRIERERACDDLVLAAGTRPSTYSQHLVEIAGAYRCPNWIAATAMTMAGRSQLEDRVRCVLDESRNRRGMTTRAAISAVGLSVLLATTVATAGRVIVRDAGGNAVATLEIPDGGSVLIESEGDGKEASGEKVPVKGQSANGKLATRTQWSQLGGSSLRNNVSSATGLPQSWDTKTGKNVLWSANLGSQSFGSPVVAHGKVFIGTNNENGNVARYPKKVDLGCLVCFDATSGKFLWQHSNVKLATGRVHDWPMQGISSTPVVDSQRLYYVTNRAVVACLDVNGFRDGKNDGSVQDEIVADNEADVVWQFDMIDELGISPKNISGCSPTTDGERLYVTTSNGTDHTEVNVPNPKAPDFICLDLKTGKLLWSAKAAFAARDYQWAGPAVGQIGGRTHVVFPGSDGWLYGFDPEGANGKARLLWKFDCNPKDADFVFLGACQKNLQVSMPVIHKGLVYVSAGLKPITCPPERALGEGDGDLWCIDPGRGSHGLDISEFLTTDKNGESIARIGANYDKGKGDTIRPNPDSRVVWHYASEDQDGDGKITDSEKFHRTWTTGPVIKDGLLIATDFSGYVHCLDAVSGKVHWTYDLFSACWASPLVADGRVFIGDEDGDVVILEHNKTLKVLGEMGCDEPIYSTPIAVGKTLYVGTSKKLLALRQTLPSTVQNDRSTTEPQQSQRATELDNVNSKIIELLVRKNELLGMKERQHDVIELLTMEQQLLKKFGENHPRVVSIRTQLKKLIRERPGKKKGEKANEQPKRESSSNRFAPVSETSWASAHGPAQRGVARTVLAQNLRLKWSLQSADGWSSTAAIVGKHTYAASLSGVLHCIDLNTSASVWTYRSMPNPKARQPPPGFCSAPCVTNDTVYVGSEDGVFHAVERTTGHSKWTFKTGGNISGCTVLDDRILMTSYDAFLYCLSPTGRVLWKYKTDDRINGTPAVVGENVLITGCDEQLRVINLHSGQQIWHTSADSYLPASPAVVADHVYFPTYAGDVIAANWRTGDVTWRSTAKGQNTGIYASASVTSQHVLIGGHDKYFRCFNRSNGDSLWKYKTSGRIESSSAVVDDRVFFAANGNLYGLRTTDGNQIFKFNTGSRITAGVAIGEGHMVVGEQDGRGNLYCFGRSE